MAEMVPLYYDAFRIATLEMAKNGPSLVYDPKWIATRGNFPISLTMPVGKQEYGADIVRPWLANLLPEADVLETVAKRLGVAAEDTVALLQEIGRDTAGAVIIGAPRDAERAALTEIPGVDALERIINELPSKPFLVGDQGVSMSLAGVQDKLPIALMAEDMMAIPINGASSTHILKPDAQKRLFGSVHNEALCMTLARLCGLRVAPVTTGKAGDRHYLLVERYDRRLRDGRWLRLHQEDFCQALGIPPVAKYEKNQSGIPGPGVHHLFSVAAAVADIRLRLLDGIIFNVLICNTDSHAKNYSLMLRSSGPEMAPLYDLLCADRWNVTRNMAQAIAGKNRGKYICGYHWQQMAGDCGLNPRATIARVGSLASMVLAKLDEAVAAVEAMPGGGHIMLSEFREAIAARCRRVEKNLVKLEYDPALEADLIDEIGLEEAARGDAPKL